MCMPVKQAAETFRQIWGDLAVDHTNWNFRKVTINIFMISVA